MLLDNLWNKIFHTLFNFLGRDISTLYRALNTRERQLLDFVRKKNMPVFGELLDKLYIAKNIKVSH